MSPRSLSASSAFGQVRAAGRGAVQVRVVDREAERAQVVGHGVDAAHAVGAEVVQRGEEGGVGVVDPVAEDVQVLVLGVHRRELDRGREFDVLNTGRLERLGHTVDGVVVGQRKQRHACVRGPRDDVGRRQRAVGMRRVRLEVERRSGFVRRAWPGTLSATPSRGGSR